MGVDLYVHRHAVVAAEVLESDEIEQQSAQQITTGPAQIESVKVATQTEESQAAPEETSETDIQQQRVEASASDSEKITLPPLHFLWQQSGSCLFLSAQRDQHNIQQSKLLESIVLSVTNSVAEKGEGKWPLTDSQQTTEIEAREFLNSFVQGRSEQSGSHVTLVLFGEESKKQFSDLKAEYQELLGKNLPGSGVIQEFRLTPSLADMLDQPQLKAVTWQTIRDLTPG